MQLHYTCLFLLLFILLLLLLLILQQTVSKCYKTAVLVLLCPVTSNWCLHLCKNQTSKTRTGRNISNHRIIRGNNKLTVIFKWNYINTQAKTHHAQRNNDFTDAYPKVFHHKFNPHFCTGNVVLKEAEKKREKNTCLNSRHTRDLTC